mgnify:CR=1 FL=1
MLHGKTAIVTGATRGIGKAIACRLAELGANVVVNGRNRELAEQIVADLTKQGRRAIACVADVGVRDEARRMVEQAAETFGGVDILVANAGVTDIGRCEDITEERLNRILDINVKGVFWCCQAVIPHMRQKKKGTIITIGSDAALEGMKYLAPYSASKFAVRGMTQALAKELGEDGITVNCVCPGIIDTDMWDVTDRDLGRLLGLGPGETFRKYVSENVLLGRAGKPEDIADAVAFLVSDQGGYITGASIPVGGGTSLN